MENIRDNFLAENDNFSEGFKIYIYSDIDYIFPLLNKTEKDLIKRMHIALLTLIYYRFHFESEEIFYQQISKKKNQDIRMILFLLFPYIDDKDNFKIHKSINNLKDLSIKPENTNIQYDRGFPENDYKYEYNILDVYNNYLVSYDTIHKCAYHLYCNWIQIIPLTLTNYHESYIYQDTIRNNTIPNNERLTGLDMRDYYHALMNDMLKDILPYKWLMYEKYDTNKNKDIMFIEEILEYFNILDFTEDNKNMFIEKWSGFYSTTNPDIIYNILLHFDVVSQNYLSDSSLTMQLNNNPEIVYNQDDNTIRNKQETFNELKTKYSNSEFIEPIYFFLNDVLIKFSKTWFGKMIFPKKIFSIKELVLLKDQIFNNNKIFNTPIYGNSYVSYKNVYNFSKSLLFETGCNITEWDGLDLVNKDRIKIRLNGGGNQWFNIGGNLRIKYGPDIDPNGIALKIYNLIRNNLTDLVFNCLVSRGILNEFKVKHSNDNIIKSFDGYYFLTQSKYNELLAYIPGKNEKPRSLPLDIINKDSNVQRLFAMDWIQQIHFYKHFFNQRIMFVTGGTGTGKSTQVPKLLLYGLFLIGNYSGKVVNTQPRINATTGNADNVSKELGVPVKVFSISKDKTEFSNNNFYLQYSTSAEKHKDQSKSQNSYIEIVTDATLLLTVKKSPFLKNTKKGNSIITEIDSYENAYDIISIDEAHEHNTNMDLLLTFLRDTIQLNNSLRLVIITATIDEDEPTYRRYYKYISDNLLYPLNNTLFDNGINTRYVNKDVNSNKIINTITKYLSILPNEISKINFDRISLDRRIHIAPPEGQTNHEIKDIYSTYPIETYEEGEKEGIKKAIELCKDATGEILFFSVTEPKIDAIVTELNKNIPAKWIAIPYYSKMSSIWKDIIEKIDTKINLITLDKKDILFAIKGQEYNKNIKNKYDHVIIVSTNIAEASITISSLKFVIDTGYVNTVSYNPILNVEEIGPEKITEAARIQRRGRVGRRQSGTVYYMYQKNSRKNIAVRYNITQQINTLAFNLIDYIREGNEELIARNLSSDELNKIYLTTIKEQYKNILNHNDFFTENFAPNNFMGNYNANYLPDINYTFKSKSGYSYETMIDPNGIFYIIHPLEIYYKRDPYTGRFINPDKKIIKYFIKFFNQLFTLRLITFDTGEFIKTKIYNIYNELKEDITEIMPADKMNYNKLLTMILGARYDKLEECLFLYNIVNKENNITLKELSRKSTSKSGAVFADSSLMMNLFGNTQSDIQVYLNIYNKLKLILPKLIDITSTELITEFNNIRNSKFKSILSDDDIKSLKNYENRNKNKIKNISIFKNISDIDDTKVELWCDQNGLDYKTINKLILLYTKDHQVIKFVYSWVKKYINYIPYFPKMNNSPNLYEFIFISSYVNYSISNLDDRNDYITAEKDPISLVNGNKILGLLKEKKLNRKTGREELTITHLIRFDQVYVPAVIPTLLYYIENNSFTWETKNYYYKSVTPDMIEKYLIPEIPNQKEENRKIKIYNNKLLSVLRLLRS